MPKTSPVKKSSPQNRSIRGSAKPIKQCGVKVEASLGRTGMVLTMGGEPTFVPLNPKGGEWATEALGPTKLGYARQLAHQLIADSFPGSVVLETSGKLFPGEVLPRWTLLLQRRADGRPVWKDPKLLRRDQSSGRHRMTQVHKVIQALAKRLGLDAKFICPLHSKDNAKKAVGYVLPIDFEEGAWISDDWRGEFDKGTVPLIPGDGYVGLRLPLGELAEKRLRRAITVELREGCVTLFIPPLMTEAYLELLTKIESVLATARLQGCILAGYAPPADPDLPTLGFASDPGVLEINLTPCSNWEEYDRQLRLLYRAADRVGLTARKFQYNGRITGTGGGAHIVFGGPESLLSPFFEFPHLLPSLIRYLQHHPALSFAFAGLYLGPSSQAPRIDESTFEALYELEIACDGAKGLGSPPNLPQFDLLFRDLLMDRSGNTHRAEISVDKLWNPFSGNGRLGLVELRSFESHPDAEVLSRVGLFMRAIIARLAAEPVTEPFIRWEGELHDRFLLPGFIWQDLQMICDDLAAHEIPFELDWLRSYWEWRFPAVGEFKIDLRSDDEESRSATVQFRQALEAWPLLGEAPNAGMVSRTVDASMDRIEVAVSEARLLEEGLLLVNGYPCAFRTVGDTIACGVRFRAFQLYPSLHPHVPAHAPLLLEWVDRDTFTVLAAARWHVWDAQGESYAKRPTSEKQAKLRFAGRWEDWPQTVGQPRWIPEIDFPPEGRHTLDLRRYPAQSRG